MDKEHKQQMQGLYQEIKKIEWVLGADNGVCLECISKRSEFAKTWGEAVLKSFLYDYSFIESNPSNQNGNS